MEHQQVDSKYLEELRSFNSEQVDISLVLGSPGVDALTSCRDMMLNASKSVLMQDDVYGLFNYGPEAGEQTTRENLSHFLTEQYGDSVNCSDVMITAGATQGLHVVLSLLCQKSSPVFIEDPSYFIGYRVMRDDFQMNLVPVPPDTDGMNTDVLDEMLTSYKSNANTVQSNNRYWAVVYLIPVFNNPTGGSYSIDRCKKLVELARKHDVLLIAEDVYNLLYFVDKSQAPQRLISFDKKSDPDYGRGHVISLGTFSKILAPSLRLGWMEGSTQMISVLIKSNLAFSGGCFNHYTSMLVSSFLNSEVFLSHIKFLREIYKRNMDTLCSVLDEHILEGSTYHKPQGGFFLWIIFRPDVDAFQFLRFAVQKYRVSFMPGICCSPTGSFKNCARLSISNNREDIISEGAKKLCAAYQDFISTLDRS